MSETDMRKLRPRYGTDRSGPWVIAEAVHERDADRVLSEPWPFDWTPPSSPEVLPDCWPEVRRAEWTEYHRDLVIGP